MNVDLSPFGYNRTVEIKDNPCARVPALDPMYEPDTQMAGHLLRWWLAERRTKSMFLVGPTGCGKTSLVNFLCATLNWPRYTMQAHSTLRAEDAEGGMVLEGGRTAFRESPIVEAYRNGGVLLLDEGNRLDPSMTTWLNAITELRPLSLFATGEEVHPHPDFRLIMTGNAKAAGDLTGGYVDSHPFCVSFANRFRTLDFAYLSEASERALIKKYGPTLPKKVSQGALKLSRRLGALRDGGDGQGRQVSVPWTTRSIIDWVDAMENEYRDMPVSTALNLTYTNALSDESEIEAVNEIVSLVFTEHGARLTPLDYERAEQGVPGVSVPDVSSQPPPAPVSRQLPDIQYFEHANGGSPKFWAVSHKLVDKDAGNYVVMTAWGPSWRLQSVNAKELANAGAAQSEIDRMISKKLGKGYKQARMNDVPQGVSSGIADAIDREVEKAACPF